MARQTRMCCPTVEQHVRSLLAQIKTKLCNTGRELTVSGIGGKDKIKGFTVIWIVWVRELGWSIQCFSVMLEVATMHSLGTEDWAKVGMRYDYVQCLVGLQSSLKEEDTSEVGIGRSRIGTQHSLSVIPRWKRLRPVWSKIPSRWIPGSTTLDTSWRHSCTEIETMNQR